MVLRLTPDHTQGSLLAELRESYEVLGTKLGLAMCRVYLTHVLSPASGNIIKQEGPRNY